MVTMTTLIGIGGAWDELGAGAEKVTEDAEEQDHRCVTSHEPW
jgi:hypothetical protein